VPSFQEIKEDGIDEQWGSVASAALTEERRADQYYIHKGSIGNSKGLTLTASASRQQQRMGTLIFTM